MKYDGMFYDPKEPLPPEPDDRPQYCDCCGEIARGSGLLKTQEDPFKKAEWICNNCYYCDF